VLVMIAPISEVHKLADAALNVCFLKPALVDGKRHVADHVVSVVAHEVTWNDGMYAIQEAAKRKAQSGG